MQRAACFQRAACLSTTCDLLARCFKTQHATCPRGVLQRNAPRRYAVQSATTRCNADAAGRNAVGCADAAATSPQAAKLLLIVVGGL